MNTIVILVVIAAIVAAVGGLALARADAAEAPATGIGGPRQPNTDVDVK